MLLWLDRRLEGEPYATTMTSVALDQDFADHVFAVPERAGGPFPVRPSSAPPTPRHTHPCPPDSVLGEPVGRSVFVACEPSFVIVVDALVAYPSGFELRLTVRTLRPVGQPGVGPGNRRSWSGTAAFPTQSLAVRLTGGLALHPLSGSGTQARFDQWFWVEPHPPPGPLGIVVAWPDRALDDTCVEVEGDAICEAATRAVTLWP